MWLSEYFNENLSANKCINKQNEPTVLVESVKRWCESFRDIRYRTLTPAPPQDTRSQRSFSSTLLQHFVSHIVLMKRVCNLRRSHRIYSGALRNVNAAGSAVKSRIYTTECREK